MVIFNHFSPPLRCDQVSMPRQLPVARRTLPSLLMASCLLAKGGNFTVWVMAPWYPGEPQNNWDLWISILPNYNIIGFDASRYQQSQHWLKGHVTAKNKPMACGRFSLKLN